MMHNNNTSVTNMMLKKQYSTMSAPVQEHALHPYMLACPLQVCATFAQTGRTAANTSRQGLFARAAANQIACPIGGGCQHISKDRKALALHLTRHHNASAVVLDHLLKQELVMLEVNHNLQLFLLLPLHLFIVVVVVLHLNLKLL